MKIYLHKYYKRLFIFGLTLFIINISTGQESRWRKQVEVSQHISLWKDYLQVIGSSGWWETKDLWASTFGLNVMVGRRITDRWELGMTLGVDHNDKQGFTSFPVSMYINYSFLRSDYGYYYFHLRGGYGPGLLAGVINTEENYQSLNMTHTGVDLGRYIAFRKKNGLAISLGYRIQRDIHRSEFKSFWYNNTQIVTHLRHQFCLRTAIVF